VAGRTRRVPHVRRTEKTIVVLLLDTHVLLWWEEGSQRLGPAARAAIRAADVVYVSSASAWEAEIKRAQGRLVFAGDFNDMIRANRFSEIAVSVRHATALRALDMHHRDPFDRMLIAQASVEGCTLVTADRTLAMYGVPLIQA
jgi:PIN domain nuclease of toxin-antitoxin system